MNKNEYETFIDSLEEQLRQEIKYASERDGIEDSTEFREVKSTRAYEKAFHVVNEKNMGNIIRHSDIDYPEGLQDRGFDILERTTTHAMILYARETILSELKSIDMSMDNLKESKPNIQ